jgi:hypothetical protein
MFGFVGLIDIARDILQFTITHTHTHTLNIVRNHVFTSRFSVAASNGGLSPSSGFVKYSRPQLSPHSNRVSAILSLTQ